MPANASKPIIAIDIDDVLASENNALRLFVNETYGLNLTPEDYDVEGHYETYWEDVWQVNPDEADRRYNAFLESEHKQAQPLIEGVVEALEELKKNYQLVVVTARDHRTIDLTHRWLEQHFPETFSQVAFTPLWGDGAEATKATICKDIGANYLIDDRVQHCNLAAEAGVKAILFGDYGWNRGKRIHADVVRLESWIDVLEYFRERG